MHRTKHSHVPPPKARMTEGQEAGPMPCSLTPIPSQNHPSRAPLGCALDLALPCFLLLTTNGLEADQGISSPTAGRFLPRHRVTAGPDAIRIPAQRPGSCQQAQSRRPCLPIPHLVRGADFGPASQDAPRGSGCPSRGLGRAAPPQGQHPQQGTNTLVRAEEPTASSQQSQETRPPPAGRRHTRQQGHGKALWLPNLAKAPPAADLGDPLQRSSGGPEATGLTQPLGQAVPRPLPARPPRSCLGWSREQQCPLLAPLTFRVAWGQGGKTCRGLCPAPASRLEELVRKVFEGGALQNPPRPRMVRRSSTPQAGPASPSPGGLAGDAALPPSAEHSPGLHLLGRERRSQACSPERGARRSPEPGGARRSPEEPERAGPRLRPGASAARRLAQSTRPPEHLPAASAPPACGRPACFPASLPPHSLTRPVLACRPHWLRSRASTAQPRPQG